MSDPIPGTMTAIEIEGGKGEATALHPVQVETPQPKAGEILIRVRAAGVNRPDVKQREGSYPPPPGASTILGLEVAGEVAVPAGRWKVGDRVCALLAGGGYAQYAAVDARQALPIPGDLDFVHAAAIPETAFTVYVNMFEHGGLQAGETVLVHGGNSGIGVMAIQMAKAFGAKVIATARGAEKTEASILLGADQAIDTTAEDFGALLKNSVDVILDIVGASYAASNMEALKPRGRLVYISMVGGNDVSLPIFTIMRKQLVITGSTLRPRTADEKARIAAQVEQRVWPWIAAGAIKSLVEQTFPLADAAKAHAWMDDSHVGKCVLTV